MCMYARNSEMGLDHDSSRGGGAGEPGSFSEDPTSTNCAALHLEYLVLLVPNPYIRRVLVCGNMYLQDVDRSRKRDAFSYLPTM